VVSRVSSLGLTCPNRLIIRLLYKALPALPFACQVKTEEDAGGMPRHARHE
jgi:hypothetical protein